MSPEQDSKVTNELGFDPDTLRKKYREERDKRLRPDANTQYVEVTGDFSHYVDDPYVTPGFSREPLTDDVEVVIIGGGFGGLLAGTRLREAGVTDLRIIEKGGDFGGTWYWNRYPGAACDIESYIYLPLLEELGYVPTEKYARASEILAHAQAIATKYSLYDNACFQTQVTAMEWDDGLGRWIIETDRGDRMRAHFVCMANGFLDRPKLPSIPGIGDFQGHSFHTSRWDYAYTGGDANSDLTGLRDKRVGLIGTGATGIQCAPALGASARQLYVFQRTPSSIDVRANSPTDPQWAKNLRPGWQRERLDNFSAIISGESPEQDLVADGWTDSFRSVMGISQWGDTSELTFAQITARMELADFQKMEQIRSRVEQLVDDPDVAAALKPYYRLFCKRPCFHDSYLQTFNRANVSLVDTHGRGVERITPGAVVVDGREYEVDCLVFATGFEVGTEFSRRAGFEPVGRDGITLGQRWADGASTLHGIHTRGFPNCFFMAVGLQNGLSPNNTHVLSELAGAIATVVKYARDHQHQTVEVSEQAEADWVDTILRLSRAALEFQQECTPGYYNNEGKPEERRARDRNYGGGPQAYFRLLRAWREDARPSGLEFDGK